MTGVTGVGSGCETGAAGSGALPFPRGGLGETLTRSPIQKAPDQSVRGYDGRGSPVGFSLRSGSGPCQILIRWGHVPRPAVLLPYVFDVVAMRLGHGLKLRV